MALFGKFTDGSLVVNAVDLSTRVKSMTVNFSANMLDATAMGQTTKVNLAGVLEWSIAAEFEDDFAASGAGSVDATLFPLVGAAAFTVTFKPTSAAVSATNPSYSGSAVLQAHPVGGAHGALLMKSVTFLSAGALTRATS